MATTSESGQDLVQVPFEVEAKSHVNGCTPNPYSALTCLGTWACTFAHYSPDVPRPVPDARPHSPANPIVVASQRSAYDSGPPTTTSVSDKAHATEHVVLNFFLDDRIHTRRLDYIDLENWEGLEGILEGLECDGIIAQELWDVRQNTPICQGDWDARIHPGCEVDIFCTCRPASSIEDDSDCNSEAEQDSQPWELEMGGASGGWWFNRWRRRVEGNALVCEQAELEPSRLRVVLGLLSVVALFGVVVLFCTS